MKQISVLTNTRHTCCLRNLTLYTVLSYTHNTHISERTYMFSRGKRENFVKEQLRIHVISFNRELYEIFVPHIQVSQAQNTFTIFTAYKTIPAAGQVLTPKGRPKITRTLYFKLQNPSQSCILNTHSSFIQPYSVIAPFSF